ncbi:MAG TPA: phosphodiester glycosidase family protein [Flavitalea sp.]|nr:phosphodiester glycosidase family protein [Flavitalea sp.]
MAPSLAFFFSLISVAAFGQLKWKPAGKEFGYLPKTIKAFYTNDSLNGRPFKAWYIISDLKDKNLDFTTEIGNGKRFTPLEYYRNEDAPYIIVNGTFFSFQTNQSLNVVIRDGRMVSYNLPSLKSITADSFYYPTRSALGISKKRKADVAWLFTDTAQRWPYAFEYKPVIAKGKTSDPAFDDLSTLDVWKWWKMETAIGGGPVLVQNKKIHITNKEEQLFLNGEKDLHPRTAMGYTKKRKLIILVVQGRFPGIAEGITLEEEAKILLSLGCVEALNLDGGGSSCLLVNGKETIKPSDKEGQRPVPAVFVIRSKKTVNVY